MLTEYLCNVNLHYSVWCISYHIHFPYAPYVHSSWWSHDRLAESLYKQWFSSEEPEFRIEFTGQQLKREGNSKRISLNTWSGSGSGISTGYQSSVQNWTQWQSLMRSWSGSLDAVPGVSSRDHCHCWSKTILPGIGTRMANDFCIVFCCESCK